MELNTSNGTMLVIDKLKEAAVLIGDSADMIARINNGTYCPRIGHDIVFTQGTSSELSGCVGELCMQMQRLHTASSAMKKGGTELS